MNSSTRTKVTSAILLTFLCACGHERAFAPPSYTAQSYYDYPSLASNTEAAPESGERGWFTDIDAYKTDVAAHIIRHNNAQTFTGLLPPMLPAIVVLRITVDRSGRITRVFVQRSRDHEASAVAMASMRRSGPLPRPLNLIAPSEQSLTFSETFLFNDDYRFQLRSLASPQQDVDI